MSQATTIKNVIFDIGNVMVRWSPEEIARLTFPEHPDPLMLRQDLFRTDFWRALNLGETTEEEVKQLYQERSHLKAEDAERLFYYVRESLIPLYGSKALLQQIKDAGYGVYALTDNVHEIVAYLKNKYDFWPLFNGAIVSAEVGYMKPSQEIYHELFNQYQLEPSECIFLDDMPHNVAGAEAVGMKAIQFYSAEQAERALRTYGLTF
ncbi:HAD family hydrolase [Celerinatantimonas sp. YJH-8]|uniref:HAD family hydrolase n=1 Tax=Celerinatantimonas sp. YJH-8 TaxID=3228714 RepID=UPI0038BEA99D